MAGTILVTGATGNVGRHVVTCLRAAGASVRAASTDVQHVRAMHGSEVEVVRLVFGEPSTYAAAFDGVDGLFLVRPPQIADVDRRINPALDVAVRAGVRHVSFLSLQGAERNPFVPHYRIERHLERLGVGHTFLRAAFFMQNLSTTHRAEIRAAGEIAVPAGRGRTAFVDARDLGAVGARTLIEAGHAGQAYELTGNQALTYAEVAAILTRVLGRRVRYTDPTLPRYWRLMRGRGYPRGFVLVTIGLYAVCRFGLAGHLSGEVRRLLGREPISFEQFAHDYADAWR